MCNANGHIITGDVMEAFDWKAVHQPTAKTVVSNDAPIAVYFPATDRGYPVGCGDWNGMCVQ